MLLLGLQQVLLCVRQPLLLVLVLCMADLVTQRLGSVCCSQAVPVTVLRWVVLPCPCPPSLLLGSQLLSCLTPACGLHQTAPLAAALKQSACAGS